MQPGDVYDSVALAALSTKIRTDPALSGFGFSYNPHLDATQATADLVLDFFTVSTNSSVKARATIKTK
jgi:hypothetical protein